jgi:alpha-1,2-mannosyltransferase
MDKIVEWNPVKRRQTKARWVNIGGSLRRLRGDADQILNWTIMTALAILTLAIYIYAIRLKWSISSSLKFDLMPEGDFTNLWSAGYIVRSGRLDWLYSSELFQAWKESRFGITLYREDWIYPPAVLLIGVPLSFLPLESAYVLWDTVTLAIAVVLLRCARLPWPVLIMGLAAPATWNSLMEGQYGTITGSLLVASLLLAPRYPIRAGVMLGFSTIKPQLGVLVPVAWVGARYWLAIVSAIITFAIIVVAATIFFGSNALILFITQSSAMARKLLEALPPQRFISNGVSVFWMFRTIGFSIVTAYAIQMIVAIVALILAYRAWKIPDADPLARMAFIVCLSLMATPYGYTSDMVAYSIAVAVIVYRNHWRLRLIHVFLWLWPACCVIVTNYYGFLFTPLIVGAAAVQSCERIRRNDLS